MAIGVWISLFAYFALMIVIGLWAMRTSSATAEDYMLGGAVPSVLKLRRCQPAHQI